MHPWKVDPMPIGQIFQFAMQAKAMRNAQQERAEERAFRERQQSFAEKSELAKLQFDLKKEQLRAGEAATEQAQEATKLAPERLSLASQHLKSYAENPTAEGFLGAVQSLKETGALPAEQLDFWEKRGLSAAAQGIVPFPAEQAASLAAEFDAQAAAMVPPEEADPVMVAKQAAELLGYGTDLDRARTDPQYRPTVKKLLIDAPANRARLAGGVMDATAPVKNELQKRIIASEGNLETIDAIENQLSEDLFDWKARAKGAAGPWLEVAGLAGDDLIAFNQKRQRFNTEAGLFVAKWIKNISGSAVNEAEAERLSRAIGDPQNMTYSQWQEVIKSMRTIENREKQMAKDTLREGFNVGKRGQRAIRPADSPAGQSLKAGDVRKHPQHGWVRLREDGKWDPVEGPQ